ncbi:MAG: hypothetical protein AAB971_02965 [Patescibacteria group bacterium]
MDDMKLPDLSELRSSRKRSKKLPPQTSAEDTSNWDDRAFSAPIIEVDREFLFKTVPIQVPFDPYDEQEYVRKVLRHKNNNG